MKAHLGILLAASLVAGCTSEKEESTSALALVNEQEITSDQFQYWWDRKGAQLDSPENRSALLEQLIEREAMFQRAEQEGILDEIDLQEQFRSLVISRLKEKALDREIPVDEEALKSLYEANKSRFQESAKSQVAVLWFQTRGHAPLASQYRNRLENLLPLVEDIPVSQGFGSLSAKNTEHRSSRYQGGIVGWLDPSLKYDPWRSAVLEIAAELEPGETSKVITRKEGAFLVRLVSQTAAGQKSFDSVRPLLVNEYRKEQRQKQAEQFQQENFDAVDIERHPNRLSQVPLSPRKDATLTATQ